MHPDTCQHLMQVLFSPSPLGYSNAGSPSVFIGHAGEQVSNSQHELTRTQHRYVRMAWLEVAHVERHKPRAALAECVHQDSQVLGVSLAGVGNQVSGLWVRNNLEAAAHDEAKSRQRLR